MGRGKRKSTTTNESTKRQKMGIINRPPKNFQPTSSTNPDTQFVENTSKRQDEQRKAINNRIAILRSKREHKDRKGFTQNEEVSKKSVNGMLQCPFCDALMWEQEKMGSQGINNVPLFTICCQQGRVRLPPEPQPPPVLKKLIDESTHYQQNIRIINSIFAFTSMGAKLDKKIMHKGGPFTYRISGQNYHRMGSLIPNHGEKPQFLQLYIFDTANEIKNRITVVNHIDQSGGLDATVVQAVLETVDTYNVLAKVFRKARDVYEDGASQEFSIRLIGQRQRGRTYDLPTTDEIAGLVVGDLDGTTGEKDVIVHQKSGGLKQISDLNPLYMTLQYPMLFPYGEPGYHDGIPVVAIPGSRRKRTCITKREFYAYQIQTRLSEGMTIIKSKRLLHQYIVDAYTSIEQERLRWYRFNQKTLRADLYNNVKDAICRGDMDAKSIGSRIILPSTYTGSPRYMAEKYHDAMAICRWYGNPDLFITMTTNPKWDEITAHLKTYGKDTANDRPDLECRVFKIKLDNLLADLNKGTFFPKPKGVVYTIEFQKRGLPHAHILLWLSGDRRNLTTKDVDNMITAELPDQGDDPEGLKLIEQHMMHGPCGNDRPKSPCMENGTCTKKYPRPFVDSTKVDEKGYVIYRRRQNQRFVMKGETRLDNRFVVPHNLRILKKYKAHINVEYCNKATAIKYLFKYITKGVDRATIMIQKGTSGSDVTMGSTQRNTDEINEYLDCRYLSACESMWRILKFNIHHHSPAVTRMPIHLPGEQTAVFDEGETLQNVESRYADGRTMLTEWFELNKVSKEARQLRYVELPLKFVWNTTDKIFTKRKKGGNIGRIVNVHPSAGEKYYIRMLANILKGPTCFKDLLTVGSKFYSTFKEACYARGLLDNDKEWHEAMDEASHWASAYLLRCLFVLILIYCEVSKPDKLWEHCWKYMADDVLKKQQKIMSFPNLQLNEAELKEYTLIEIEYLLRQHEKSLTDFPDLPQPNKTTLEKINSYLDNEFKVNLGEEKDRHEQYLHQLNEQQKKIYDDVLQSVLEEEGKLFFVYGAGGTGKTFLYKTIISALRSKQKNVMPVASSAIAALLLPGGRTTHSRFKIPLNLHEDSTCNIGSGSTLAQVLKNVDLIIWDEAPMAHKHTFEAVDRTMRDIMSRNDATALTKPFGGKTVLLGGDFRQILPVIPQGTRQETVAAAINRSYLWEFSAKYILTKNMRVNEEEKTFARWILKVGNGDAPKKKTIFTDFKKRN